MAVIHVEHEPSALSRSAARPSISATGSLDDRLAVRRRQVVALRRMFVLGDALATLGVVALLVGTDRLTSAVMASAVLLAVMAHAYGADGPRTIAALRCVLRPTTLVCGATAVGCAVVGAASTGRDLMLGAALAGAALVAVRLAARIPSIAPRVGLGRRRRLIVGDPASLERTAAQRAPDVESGEVILVVTRAQRPETDDTTGKPVFGDQRSRRDEGSGPAGLVERVVRTALDNAVERVTVIPGESWQRRQLRELSWLLEGTGIDMVISTDLDGIAPHRTDVVQQEGRLMIKIGSASPRGAHSVVKGLVDRMTAAGLLLMTAPFLAAVMLAIRMESSGPALFKQTRVREGGGTFTMLKFRTMVVDAEQQISGLQELNLHGMSGPLFKMENDPRITRIGHLLRRTSLDELPQLVNVLTGQMSLIGPRPALPGEVQQYDYVARRRLAVKPGMTGLWQVSGRSRLSWDESIGFDLEYVDNWSPAADAAIAVRTIAAVVKQDGAF